MKKIKLLSITETILDLLGFSEYWDENGSCGGRTLKFSDGTMFRICEHCESEDETDGSGDEPIYCSNHWCFLGWFAVPENKNNYDLFFIHELYICIENEHPKQLPEFISKCKELNMMYYINSYLESIKSKKNHEEN